MAGPVRLADVVPLLVLVVAEDGAAEVEQGSSTPAVAAPALLVDSDSDGSDDDDDVAPGRENKKRPRSDSVSADAGNEKKLAKGNDGGGALVETVTMTIPSELAGAVIGRSGTVIRATREASGANVVVTKEEISNGLREVTMSGTPAQIAAAKAPEPKPAPFAFSFGGAKEAKPAAAKPAAAKRVVTKSAPKPKPAPPARPAARRPAPKAAAPVAKVAAPKPPITGKSTNHAADHVCAPSVANTRA